MNKCSLMLSTIIAALLVTAESADAFTAGTQSPAAPVGVTSPEDLYGRGAAYVALKPRPSHVQSVPATEQRVLPSHSPMSQADYFLHMIKSGVFGSTVRSARTSKQGFGSGVVEAVCSNPDRNAPVGGHACPVIRLPVGN